MLGRYPEAVRSCAALEGRVPALVALTCRAPALAATGADASAADSSALLPQSAAGGAWAPLGAGRASLLGRRSRRGAEPHLRAALREDPERPLHPRAATPISLLDLRRRDGGRRPCWQARPGRRLLLRLAIAETGAVARAQVSRASALCASGSPPPAAGATASTAASRRGSRWPIEKDAAAALALALASWRVQREPWDARLVLEAARRRVRREQRAAGAAGRGLRGRARDGGGWRRGPGRMAR